MAADGLAPCINRSSAAMVLSMQDKSILVFHKEGSQLAEGCWMPPHCRESIATANTGTFLSMCSANERQRFIVTLSFIGWALAQNDPANICIFWCIFWCFLTNIRHTTGLKTSFIKTRVKTCLFFSLPGCWQALLLFWPRYPGRPLVDCYRTKRAETGAHWRDSSLVIGHSLCWYPWERLDAMCHVFVF